MPAFLRPLYGADSGLCDSTRIFCGEHIAPKHQALVAMLAQRCGASSVAAELHQLAFALLALAHDYWLSAQDMEGLLPGVVYGPGAYERSLNRLAGFGQALIEAEQTLRKKCSE